MAFGKATKVFIDRFVCGANVVTIVMMLVTGFSGYINPVDYPTLSTIGFAFPAFVLINIAFLAFWVLFCCKRIVIPILGFLLAYSPIQDYCPMNLASSLSGGDLKVVSYNVLAFNSSGVVQGEPNPILEYLTLSDADIICLQEYSRIGGQDSLWREMDRRYPHSDTIMAAGNSGSDCLAVYSRFPIKSKERLNIISKGNTAGVFTLRIGDEDVHVINAHLETVGLTVEERQGFRDIVHGNKNRYEVKTESKLLITKIGESSAIRAPQADLINAYVLEHKGESVIFCGDINDHPLSYVHRKIAENLNDCYREAGRYLGFTFHYNSMHVRIDNIMASNDWEALDCHVDKSIDLSDHYPMVCYLKK